MSVRMFDDPEAEQEVLERGYTLQPLLDEAEIEHLIELHDRLTAEVPMDWYVTAYNSDVDYKRRVCNGIRNVIEAKLKRLMPNYQVIMASFVTKRANTTDGTLGMHQDYSFVDHAEHVALNVWCPLVDVDRRNGCMNVVEGSHLFGHISATPPNPAPHNSVSHILQTELMTEVPMKAGTAMIFDSRLLHTTYENLTDQQRPAALLNTVPSCVAPRIYFWNESSPDQLEVYEINNEFCLQMKPNTYIPDAEARGARFLHLMPYVFDAMSPQDLEHLLRKRRASEALVSAGSSPAAGGASRSVVQQALGWLHRARR